MPNPSSPFCRWPAPPSTHSLAHTIPCPSNLPNPPPPRPSFPPCICPIHRQPTPCPLTDPQPPPFHTHPRHSPLSNCLLTPACTSPLHTSPVHCFSLTHCQPIPFLCPPKLIHPCFPPPPSALSLQPASLVHLCPQHPLCPVPTPLSLSYHIHHHVTLKSHHACHHQ